MLIFKKKTLHIILSHFRNSETSVVFIRVHENEVFGAHFFQVKEYDKLKQETGKQAAVLRRQLYDAEKEKKDLQDILDRELCKKVHISRQQQGIGKAIDNAILRLQKIDSYIRYL